jgi:membrane-bound serine protease (ClpP class)
MKTGGLEATGFFYSTGKRKCIANILKIELIKERNMNRIKKLVAYLAMLLCLIGLVILPTDVAAASAPVVVTEIRGEIDAGQVALIHRAIGEAVNQNAGTLLVEIETFGGQVDAAVKIRDMISESPLQTICYIKNRAWSAGALIAISHKHIVIAPGGSIGAAEPIPTTEKTVSAVRAEFAATAAKMGRNPKVAEAMVDKTLGFEKYAIPGKILSLTDIQALEVGYAEIVAADRAAVLAHYDLQDAKIIEVKGGWAEKLAGWLADPVIKSGLIGLIFLAVMTEIKTAGMGVAALVGLAATALFFATQWMTGLATGVQILLFLAGLILLGIELFVPGFGVFGLAGIGCIMLSLFLTLGGDWGALNIMAGGLVLAVIAFAVILRYLPSSKLWNKLVLHDTEKTKEGYTSSDDLTRIVGQEGMVITMLRPAGTVEIASQVYDVVSEGRFIQPGIRVKVLSVQGNRILVRETDE